MKTILRIRQERISRELTLEYVGQQVGLTKTAIQAIETGQNKPSYDVMCKLEQLFNMTHDELFEPVSVGD